MRLFGIHPELIRIWERAHVHTSLHDRNCGVKHYGDFQRKSGDAATFFGNTLFLMGVISTLYNREELIGVFAGDDSVLFSHVELEDQSLYCADMYNLEAPLSSSNMTVYTFAVIFLCRTTAGMSGILSRIPSRFLLNWVDMTYALTSICLSFILPSRIW